MGKVQFILKMQNKVQTGMQGRQYWIQVQVPSLTSHVLSSKGIKKAQTHPAGQLEGFKSEVWKYAAPYKGPFLCLSFQASPSPAQSHFPSLSAQTPRWELRCNGMWSEGWKMKFEKQHWKVRQLDAYKVLRARSLESCRTGLELQLSLTNRVWLWPSHLKHSRLWFPPL